MIVKGEHNAQGSNPRFVVSNKPGDPQELYDDVYCQRGEMENRIKEQQLGLFANRTSCHKFLANQFRLLLIQRRMCWCRRCGGQRWRGRSGHVPRWRRSG